MAAILSEVASFKEACLVSNEEFAAELQERLDSALNPYGITKAVAKLHMLFRHSCRKLLPEITLAEACLFGAGRLQHGLQRLVRARVLYLELPLYDL